MLVPVVAIVDGVKIEFYPDEHPPPHFHARYAEFVAQIEIRTSRFYVARYLPRNSAVCYLGPPDINRVS
jgi:hypothetical protein